MKLACCCVLLCFLPTLLPAQFRYAASPAARRYMTCLPTGASKSSPDRQSGIRAVFALAGGVLSLINNGSAPTAGYLCDHGLGKPRMKRVFTIAETKKSIAERSKSIAERSKAIVENTSAIA
jgi:hypothetical protein